MRTRDFAAAPECALFRIDVEPCHFVDYLQRGLKLSHEQLRHVRWGLCCLFVDEPVKFRTTTARALAGLSTGERLAKLSGLCLHNSETLLMALRTADRIGVGAFRVLSGLLPLYTHPDFGYRLDDLPDAEGIRMALAAVAAFRQSHGLRLSFHPDQFVVLNSPRPEVVASSIAELDYQAMVAEKIGAEVINIHLGGAYGDKKAAIRRFAASFADLPDRVRCQLSIENDDVSYTPADLLPLAAQLELPVVYDVHHHRCNPDGMSVAEASESCATTWLSKGKEPFRHISSPKNGWEGNNWKPHADYIDIDDFPAEWLDSIFPFTLDIEAKAKELAFARLERELAAKIKSK